MPADKTQTWLKVASALTIGFGLLIGLAAHPATAGVTLVLTDLIFWPVDGAQTLAAPETRLLCAIIGGVMAGWGLMMWLVTTRLYPRDPALARMLILTGIGTWFVIDCAGSLVAGAPLNVLFNVVFLLLFVIPLRHAPRHTGPSARSE